MMKFILLILFLVPTVSNAAVLVFTGNGSSTPFVYKASLTAAATAADCAGKRIVVTSAQVLSSDLTWPSDRELSFDSGGSIKPNGHTFNYSGSTTRWPASVVFDMSGGGTVVGLADPIPAWFNTGTVPTTTQAGSAPLPLVRGGTAQKTLAGLQTSLGLQSFANEALVTAAKVMTNGDFGVPYQIYSASGDFNITLPPVSGNTGQILTFTVHNYAAGLYCLNTADSSLIDFDTQRCLWAGESVTLRTNGSWWTKIAGKNLPTIASLTSFSGQTLTPGIWNAIVFGGPTTFGSVGADFYYINRGWNATNGNFTAPRDGRYRLTANIPLECPTMAANLTVALDNPVSSLATAISPNGSGGFNKIISSVNDTQIQQATTVMNLTKGQIVRVIAKYTGGACNAYVGAGLTSTLYYEEIPTW